MKGKDIIKSFIKILISFALFYFLLFLFNHTGFEYIEISFTHSKYSLSLAAEIIAFLFITLFLIITGKKKVFLEKRVGFFKSIGLGVPLLIFIAILTFSGIVSILQDGTIHIPNLIASFLLCVFIGLFEEFLCRGWLLNSFLDKIGRNRKGVMWSIILSGIVFGSLHFTNILSGQSVFMTVIQVCQTLMIGIVLGIIYFRTKNIWALAFLHTFYDFGSFLSDVNTLKDCTYISPLPTSYYLYMICATFIICGFYLCSFFILSRKTKINDLLEEKEKLTPEDYAKDERKKLFCSLGMIAIWFIQALIPMDFDIDSLQVCYSYEEKMVANHIISSYSLDSYQIEYSLYQDIENNVSFENLFQAEEIPYVFSFQLDGNNLFVKNEIVHESYTIDKEVMEYVVYEDDLRYVLFYTKLVEENSTISYLEIPKDALDMQNSLLSYIREHSFTTYVLPDIKSIGTYQEEDNSYIYPYMESLAHDAFVITEDNHLYVLKK